MPATRGLRLWTCFVVGVLVAGRVCASPIQVTVDTSSLSGSIANLAFDLLDGGPPPNSVTISSFATDGTLGSTIVPTGDVTGTLPGTVKIGDSGGFNEYLQDITLGNSLSFVFDTDGNPADAGSSPDAFSFLLLDPDTGLSLIPSLDPTGNDALFLYNVGEPDPFQGYSELVQTVEVPGGVPEPGALALAMAALLGLGLVGSTRR